MNSKKIWVIATATLVYASCSQGFGPRSFFTTRSQGQNLAREIVGWEQETHRYDMGRWYTTAALTIEYMRSFSPTNISEFILGAPFLVFSGSQRMDRLNTDILADYFGLPGTFLSRVCFTPIITNFTMDFNWYVGFDALLCGMYFQLHLPVVHSKWDLKLQECIIDSGSSTTTAYPGGYFSPQPLLTSQLPKSVEEAFRGKTVFGDMQDPLEYGKIFGRQTITRAADLQATLGWDFLLGNWYHLGLYGRLTAPTGNASKAEFFFEPMAGNGHHVELGGGFTGHVILWERENHQMAFWGYAYVGHLFASEQRRSYDFVSNGPGSRYILLAYTGAPGQGLNVGEAPDDIAATNQYLGRLVPAVNITSLRTDISLDYQLDFLVKAAYQREDGFEFDFGYEFWMRSEEKISKRECFPSDCYVLKGDAQIYGFTDPSQVPVRLNASESMATIRSGQGDGNFRPGEQFRNANVDNAITASDESGTPLLQVTAADAATFNIVQASVRTSNPPIFLSDADIDQCSGILPKGYSNKFFVHANKIWIDECVAPYLGLGGMVEWAHTDVANNSAFSQWAIWIKGGLSY